MKKIIQKTIVLGSLMIVMTLPVTILQSADAQEEEKTTTQLLDEYIIEFNGLEDERLEMSKLRYTEGLSFDPQKRIDEIRKKQDVILLLVEELAPQEVYDDSHHRSKRAVTTGSNINFSHTDTPCSSRAPNELYTIWGGIDFNVDTIAWYYHLPDTVNVRDWWNCEDRDFEEITIQTRNNSKRQSCTMIDSNNPTSTVIQPCNCGIDNNNLLSIHISIDYEDIDGNVTNKDFSRLHRATS